MTKSQEVKNFMWEQSDSFQRSWQYFSEKVFNTLNKNFNPEVTLIAVLEEKNENKENICIEPETYRVTSDCFEHLTELSNQLAKADRDSLIKYDGDQEVRERLEESNRLQVNFTAFCSAIKKILEKYNYFHEKKFYCSFPSRIEGYLVFIVLGIDLKVYDSYYRLIRTNYRNSNISPSLLDSLAEEFIDAALSALREDNTGYKNIKEDIIEIKRRSGNDFMFTISRYGSFMASHHDLFEHINTISSLRYEGKESLGKLLIAAKDHEKIKMTMELETPIFIGDYRKVRKFLELSSDDNYLISDADMVYGLGTILQGYNPRNENLYIINFTNHYQWELIHDNNILMKVAYREPFLPEEKINFKKFSSDFKRIFKNLDEKNIKDLWEIILESTQQRHGTMLVISDKAQDEAERLKNQSFRIKPQKINKELISMITTIDGAVLLDSKGTCYSIGVILDGIATEKGDSARGARYNSALRYYDFIRKDFNCVIVVVSEDGMIDIFPDLKPQIRHMDIGFKINNLEDIKKSENPDNKKFQEQTQWLCDHKFYLSQEECDKIKSLISDIVNKFPGKMINICRGDLIPDPEMNESYFSDNQGLV